MKISASKTKRVAFRSKDLIRSKIVIGNEPTAQVTQFSLQSSAVGSMSVVNMERT